MSQRVSIWLQAATNRRATLAGKFAAHAKVCATCVSLAALADAYCDEGWQLAREYRAADGDVRAAEAAQAARQEAVALEALFGEQLPGWVSE